MAKKIKYPHLLGSKWTARQTTWGWRHFQVINRRNEGKWVFAELMASCDNSVRFWVNAAQLKDYELWEAGWKTHSQMQTINREDEELIII
ncbi:MAG: hypothetical protein N5P05_000464 [Chroococcopsis gigantea SAG 12.99]|jgi:tryptophan-rich hypothetical protein|nr:TIGR02450 family Trp-rich protein [Chlorogloea purpurea SAG 13.99]MDV2998858.1 hypothetical protein [Chroococcopsis gigantea SAG 12.99]